MDLRDFVSTTLTEIVGGIERAQQQNDDSAAVISPYHADIYPTDNQGRLRTVDGLIEYVAFDVAVSATEVKTRSGGGDLGKWVLHVGGQVGSEVQNTATNRVKFRVPVSLPTQRVKQHRQAK